LYRSNAMRWNADQSAPSGRRTALLE
jgi:hypothetical protein